VAWSRPTGWRTSEIALVVANDGSLVLQPVFDGTGSPIGLIRSPDEGRFWTFVLPSDLDDPPRELGVGQDMIVDRDTGRIFWVPLAMTEAQYGQHRWPGTGSGPATEPRRRSECGRNWQTQRVAR